MIKRLRFPLMLFIFFLLVMQTYAENGYDLWLRYQPLTSEASAKLANSTFNKIAIADNNPTNKAIKYELGIALPGLINKNPEYVTGDIASASLVIGTPADFSVLSTSSIKEKLADLGNDGFIIQYLDKNKKQLAIVGNTAIGTMYGTYHLLRLLEMEATPTFDQPIVNKPKVTDRILNHWDNLDRTVERGYAGFSIWDWHKLPDYIDKRYVDYARANASIGINGTVLTNVNANAFVLTEQYITKVKALAEVFRPYGIKVYLTARFSAPIEIGHLKTADPLNEEVIAWWQAKVDEIYKEIPDFGGFLVKANSEGQPGPQNYDRSHADGANMMARALKPYNGIVMWRAFVYSHEAPDDRAKQANNEFEPLDGQFEDNVFIQVKNGAIDFQPREPFHPLFGAMKKTKLALELQVTMEYLGQATNLVYLAPLFKECLDSKTYRPNESSTVASVIDGSDFGQKRSVIAAVANIGNDFNWTGHLFGQSSWYAYGRLAWDHELTSAEIASEWIDQTFELNKEEKGIVEKMMLDSHEITVNYSTPLGLHHIMGRSHHYGPGPWVTGGRADWTSPYYHQADSAGIGFNRTSTGSDALSQYAPQVEKEWENPATCPDKYLLWFHHLPWTYKMKSGNILWDEICFHYDTGVKGATRLKEDWKKVEGSVDNERFEHVSMLLTIQEKEARWWRNSCLLYFQTFSGMDFPKNIEQPTGSLEEYKKEFFPSAPGIKPSW